MSRESSGPSPAPIHIGCGTEGAQTRRTIKRGDRSSLAGVLPSCRHRQVPAGHLPTTGGTLQQPGASGAVGWQERDRGFHPVPLHGQGMVRLAHAARPRSCHPGCSRETCLGRTGPVLPRFLSGVLLQSRNSAVSACGEEHLVLGSWDGPRFWKGWLGFSTRTHWRGKDGAFPGQGRFPGRESAPGFTGALPARGLIKGPG